MNVTIIAALVACVIALIAIAAFRMMRRSAVKDKIPLFKCSKAIEAKDISKPNSSGVYDCVEAKENGSTEGGKIWGKIHANLLFAMPLNSNYGIIQGTSRSS